MKELSTDYNPLEVEKRVQEWWRQHSIQSKVRELRKGRPLFRFLEGPPTANGFMHIGHARGRAMKDVVLRYQTMRGNDVWRMAGWDCQGLPVEIEVEKKLGLHSKRDIERIGLEKFVSECNHLVDDYIAHWRKTSERLGLWLDYDSAYETRKDDYIEMVWWVIKKAFERGLLKEDFKVVPTCPRCETPLSSHEVAQGYAPVVDPSIYVKFHLVSKQTEFILIWTTTPWTLPSDEAVTVHPNYDYDRVRVGSEVWILASDLVSRVMEELKIQSFDVLSTVKGRELEGLKYIHPLLEETPAHKSHDAKFSHSIVMGEHVIIEEGTGCVHTAPAHGPDDFEVGQKYGLETFSSVDQTGRFSVEAGKYAGKFVKDADAEIIDDLRKKNLLVKSGEIEHDYPLCWRCDSPLIYRADRQWFIRTEPVRTRMVDENKEIDWVPDWAGRNRFGEWLVNSGDWCISRSRIWGSPLNVWKCEKCEHFEVVGTRAELKRRAKKMPANFQLHRPWIDEVELPCDKCSATMRRVPAVLDTWLDSGTAHSASVNYLNNQTLFTRVYPYDFVTEAIDQTRGWFYSLLATSVVLFDKKPYKRVLCQGHVLDKFGQKMSKSKGNVVWAQDALEKQGADPIRVYILSKGAPEDTLTYDEDEIVQVKRKLTVFWNVYEFSRSYMALDRFIPEDWQTESIRPSLKFEDKWLLSKSQALVYEVTRQMEELRLHKALRAILDFVLEDISRFYIRLIRRRTWIEASDIEKTAAYWTLHTVLTICAKLLSPFAPHIAESLYQSVTNSETSVQFADWPPSDEVLRNLGLEDDMVICREAIRAVATARQRKEVKLRWPIQALTIATSHDKSFHALSKLIELLQSQTNSKQVRVLKPGENPEFIELSLHPNFKVMGPQFKKDLPAIMKTLSALKPVAVQQLLASSVIELRVDGQTIVLSKEMVTVKENIPEKFVTEAFSHGTVYLDCTRTPELVAESLAKEIVRRVQIMRKEMRLRIEDYVDMIVIAQDRETLEVLISTQDYIRTEVRAEKFQVQAEESADRVGAYTKKWEVEDEEIEILLRKHEN